MGEKLAGLNFEGNAAKTDLPAKPPSVDSVNIVIKKALRAEDRTLLIDCLYRQDEKLIESRVSAFNHTLLLSSCLDLLYAESVDDGAEENDIVAPVIYEDEDESDGGSEDSMEIDTIEGGEEPLVYNDISDGEENGEISE